MYCIPSGNSSLLNIDILYCDIIYYYLIVFLFYKYFTYFYQDGVNRLGTQMFVYTFLR